MRLKQSSKLYVVARQKEYHLFEYCGFACRWLFSGCSRLLSHRLILPNFDQGSTDVINSGAKCSWLLNKALVIASSVSGGSWPWISINLVKNSSIGAPGTGRSAVKERKKIVLGIQPFERTPWVPEDVRFWWFRHSDDLYEMVGRGRERRSGSLTGRCVETPFQQMRSCSISMERMNWKASTVRVLIIPLVRDSFTDQKL